MRSCVSVPASVNACPPQRPSAGHGGARVALVHVGQVAKRPSLQEDEGQLPGGPPAIGLRAAAPREIPDFPQHRQVRACVRARTRTVPPVFSNVTNLSLNLLFQVWQNPGGPGQFSRFT